MARPSLSLSHKGCALYLGIIVHRSDIRSMEIEVQGNEREREGKGKGRIRKGEVQERGQKEMKKKGKVMIQEGTGRGGE